jgi:hypothetical protein
MLTRHSMQRKHWKNYELMLQEDVTKKKDIEQSNLGGISTNIHERGKAQSSMQSFVKVTPTFENKLLDWIIDMYQPLHACEHPSFQEMCRSLNAKAPLVGVSKLQNMISNAGVS